MNSKREASFRKAVRRMAALCLVLPVLTLVGCSGEKLAKVTGKVTFNGQPVTGGRLTFAPIPVEGDQNPGKAAGADVQSDGSFVAGTYSASDGALVGRHRVFYIPPPLAWPPGVEPKSSVSPPLTGFEGLVPKNPEIEVKPGTNTLDMELVPATRK